MRGFTGEYYNGMPVFIREEYERAHCNDTELDRINDFSGNVFSEWYSAQAYLERLAPNYLYGRSNVNCGYAGCSISELWEPYKNGYIHKITAEYVPSLVKPNYDSYPFWCSVCNKTHKLGTEFVPSAYLIKKFCELMSEYGIEI